MPVFTCEQALSFVAESSAPEVAPEDAVAVSSHLRVCDGCRIAMLSCNQALSLFDNVRRGDLAPEAAVLLTTHLVQCDSCRTQADDMRRAQAVLMDLMGIEMPAALSRSLDTATEEHLTRQLRARAFQTPLGWGSLAYTDDGGLILVRTRQRSERAAYDSLHDKLEDFVVQQRPRDDVGGEAVRKLHGYFEGRRVRFDEPLDLSLVSPFASQVLEATARIPYGQVRAYGWVAREIGRPKAARAVGSALHINPLAPIIPCHRVIASDDTLGGYGGGPRMKRWLLRLEGYLK